MSGAAGWGWYIGEVRYVQGLGQRPDKFVIDIVKDSTAFGGVSYDVSHENGRLVGLEAGGMVAVYIGPCPPNVLGRLMRVVALKP